MIEVQNLTRYYGQRKAIDSLNFTVQHGEILGFLGPNGAGKTTTLKIITTYLCPTSGTVLVDGKDIRNDPLEVRKKLGYLPESAPSYQDMKVREFLLFRMKLKGLSSRERKEQFHKLLEKCRLEQVSEQLIGELSKGYRQRVGFAEALCNDPPILILDEPTAGMDPAQQIEIRNFVRELSARHTILFSTHLLSEVEQLCERVVIIHKGMIVAKGKVEELRSRVSCKAFLRLESSAPREELEPWMAGEIGTYEFLQTREEFHSYRIFPQKKEGDDRDPRDKIYEMHREKKWKLRTLFQQEPSLEEIFIELTK